MGWWKTGQPYSAREYIQTTNNIHKYYALNPKIHNNIIYPFRRPLREAYFLLVYLYTINTRAVFIDNELKLFLLQWKSNLNLSFIINKLTTPEKYVNYFKSKILIFETKSWNGISIILLYFRITIFFAYWVVGKS